MLIAEDMPAAATVTFVQGTASPSGGFFGDGLSCVGGSTLRIATKIAVNGSASYPEGSEPPISVVGMITPGGMVRGYQAYYRDPARFCTSATFNLSNGYRIQWIP